MKNIKILFSLVIIASLFMTSCKREDIRDAAEEAAADEELASSLFDDAFSQSDNAYSTKLGGLKSTETDTNSSICAAITINNDNNTIYPKIITCDFGSGCTDTKGNTRSGKIITTVTGAYRTVGAVRTITLDNYYVNGNKIEGNKTVTNMGKNSLNQSYFTIKVENGKATTDEGRVITWNSNRVRTWVEGEKTSGSLASFLDDAYEITGNSSGVTGDGENYTVTITSALVVSVSCRHINKGSTATLVGENPEVVIDYGDGTCDAQATLSYKNKTKTILLRGK